MVEALPAERLCPDGCGPFLITVGVRPLCSACRPWINFFASDEMLESTGGAGGIDLVAALKTSPPGLLRAQEHVCIPVTPGKAYRIVARDDSPDGWLAFTEPWERGALGGFTAALYSSCWIFTGLGAGLLALLICAGLLPARPPESASAVA